MKMASGEYRRQWHKYLPLAVLIYKTTYHYSIGSEPSNGFHGRIPYNVLDHKLGNNPNKNFLPTTDFGEELQQRTKIPIDQTKKNITQSYFKYKEYYDRKTKATPLQEKDYCFVLQPKADSQGSKIPLRVFRWIGPFIVQKVLPNNNYIGLRSNTNKTQILHRIRLKKFVPNTPLEDKYTEEKLQPNDEIIIPQDDLYTIAWEADFEYELFEPRKNNWPDTATRLVTDATTSEADDYVIENESSSVNESERSSERTNENDVSDNETRPRPASSRDASSPLNESPSGTENENDVTNEKMAMKMFQKGAQILPCPEYRKKKILRKT